MKINSWNTIKNILYCNKLNCKGEFLFNNSNNIDKNNSTPGTVKNITK